MTNSKTHRGFTPMHYDMVDKELRHLPASAFCLYLGIARLTSSSKVPAVLTAKRIREYTGMSHNTFIKARKLLIDRKLITAHSGPNQTTYTVRLTTEQ